MTNCGSCAHLRNYSAICQPCVEKALRLAQQQALSRAAEVADLVTEEVRGQGSYACCDTYSALIAKRIRALMKSV